MRVKIPRLVLAALTMLALVSVTFAVAAKITVPSTRLANQAVAITANTLKPSNCAAISLTTVVICPSVGGACNGTKSNELILGSANVDTINGNGGNDCMLGGGGNDSINGGTGTDVCIGGPGTDTFKSCQTQIQ